jgi:hypothetical protein
MAKRSAKTPATVQERILALRFELAQLQDDLQVREICDTWPKNYFAAKDAGDGADFGRYDYNNARQNRANLSAELWIRAVMLHLNECILNNQLKAALVELPAARYSVAKKEEYVRMQLERLLA